MSFQTISLAEIANGAPIDTALFNKIKNDLDDLDHRLDLVEAGTPGPVNPGDTGGTGGTENTGTAYRYYKLTFMESFYGSGNANSAVSGYLTINELKFKYDGTVQNLTGNTITANTGSGLANINDGVIDGAAYWLANPGTAAITVDLGVSKIVTDVLFSPQMGPYNMPKKFDVEGSNDGLSYTLIKSFNVAAYTAGAGDSDWQNGKLTSFSLAAAPKLLWNAINNSSALASAGNGELHRSDAGAQLGTNPIAYNSVKKTGDFTFSGVYKHGVGPGSRQMLIGLSKIIPVNYGVQQAGYGIIFQDGNIAHIWDASSSNVTLVDGQSYNFEIKRVGAVVTYKIDTTTLGTYSVGTEDVYITACLQIGLSQIVSTSFEGTDAVSLASVSGRYFEIEMTDFFNTAGVAVVFSEIEVIEGGSAKTLDTMGATIVASNLSGSGNVSNGSFTGDAGNYRYGTTNPTYMIIDLGSVKTINGFAIGMTTFSGTVGPNGLNMVPATVKLYKSDTVATHQGGTLTKTLTYVETDWPKDTRKDILF